MTSPEIPYNDSHRAFLQSFLARSVMTLEDAQAILAGILSAYEYTRAITAATVSEALLVNYVAKVNEQLSAFDLEIRSARPQAPGPERQPAVWALVNAASDAFTQLATTHSPDEMAFVKRLLDAMFETHNTRRAEVLALSSIQALNLHKVAASSGGESQGASGASLTMPQAQQVLVDLVDEGWFDKSANGFLSLSPRALMELRGWLIETYNEPVDDANSDDEGGVRVKMCEACREIVTVGQRCSNAHCQCRLHDPCVHQFFGTLSEKRCPLCKSEWTEQDFVGERAARPAHRNRTSTATSSRRTTMNTVVDD